MQHLDSYICTASGTAVHCCKCESARSAWSSTTTLFLPASVPPAASMSDCPCLNGGTFTGGACACPSGYGGLYCEEDDTGGYQSCHSVIIALSAWATEWNEKSSAPAVALTLSPSCVCSPVVNTLCCGWYCLLHRLLWCASIIGALGKVDTSLHPLLKLAWLGAFPW